MHALSPSRIAASAQVFAALGDPSRLQIVARLCSEGPQAAVRLTDGAGISRQAVAKHLHALAETGLVRSRRVGRVRIWGLQPQRLEEVRVYLSQISAQWDQALSQLQAFVTPDWPDTSPP